MLIWLDKDLKTAHRSSLLAETGCTTKQTTVVIIIPIMTILSTWKIFSYEKVPIRTASSLVKMEIIANDVSEKATLTRGFSSRCFSQPTNPSPPPRKIIRTMA
jgi:hypothetical protein